MVDGLFTTHFYSRRSGRFLNSAFPNKKNLTPKIEVYLWQTNLKANVCRDSTFQVNRTKECYMTETTSYLEEPSRHFCQHFLRGTTQQTFSAINLASQQKTTKAFFSSQVGKQFKLFTAPLKPSRCCFRTYKLLTYTMFENSTKIYF